MQMEAVTTVTDWLRGEGAGAGHGVNDYLQEVPREDGRVPPPAVAFIGDPYRDDRVAAFDAPPRYPAIYVLPDGPVEEDGDLQPNVRTSRSVGVAIRYLVRDGKQSRSMVDAALTLRAIKRSLAAYFEDDEAGRAGRSRDGVHVVAANSFASGPWREQVGEATAVAVVGLDLEVRDTAPSY